MCFYACENDLPDLQTGPFPKFYSYQLCSRDTDIAKAREEFLNETGGDNEKVAPQSVIFLRPQLFVETRDSAIA